MAWLDARAAYHDAAAAEQEGNEEEPKEIGNIFKRANDTPTINNAQRHAHRDRRVQMIREWIESLPPGYEFTIRQLSDWFHANRPPELDFVTLTPLRNDLMPMLDDKIIDRKRLKQNGGIFCYFKL